MFIDWTIVFSLLIPALVAVAGWFLAHWLTAKRERLNKRRELRLQVLDRAYLTLMNTSRREELTPEQKLDFEKFISEIQLYGTLKQINFVKEIVRAFNRKDPLVHFDPLLIDLRDSLRAELKMKPVSEPIWWFRFQPSPSKLERENELKH